MKALYAIALFFTLSMVSVSCDENINEPVVENQAFSLDENSPAGTVVGIVDAYDLDIGQVLSFSIADGNEEGTFNIDSASGLIRVEDPAQLDYESRTQLRFGVEVSDSGEPVLSTTANMTVSLNDVNEFPPEVGDQVFSVEEGSASGTLLGTIEASDPESHQGLLFFIFSGDEEGNFNLGDQTGELSVNNAEAFDYQVNQQLVFTVLVRDVHVNSLSANAEITVNITPK